MTGIALLISSQNVKLFLQIKNVKFRDIENQHTGGFISELLALYFITYEATETIKHITSQTQGAENKL